VNNCCRERARYCPRNSALIGSGSCATLSKWCPSEGNPGAQNSKTWFIGRLLISHLLYQQIHVVPQLLCSTISLALSSMTAIKKLYSRREFCGLLVHNLSQPLCTLFPMILGSLIDVANHDFQSTFTARRMPNCSTQPDISAGRCPSIIERPPYRPPTISPAPTFRTQSSASRLGPAFKRAITFRLCASGFRGRSSFRDHRFVRFLRDRFPPHQNVPACCPRTPAGSWLRRRLRSWRSL
jgi:hypothetical protein